jgi:hypothetical protein
VPRSSIVSKLRRPAAPLLLLSAVFVAAGGFVHLREWLDTYRHVPTSLPGAEVVRIGFVINAAVSAVLVLALVDAVFASRRVAALFVAATVLFEAASLATLIQTRRGSVLGWMETGWSRGATQSRAVEIGALVALSAAAALLTFARREPHGPIAATLDIAPTSAPAAAVPAA